MSPLFTCIVIIMGLLAVMGIVVGVANDAVNFLNSALGSKVAPRRVILWIAAAGILVGTLTSSGMMEVARSGVFYPGQFSFQEIMMLFLGMMLGNILLLDLYNTLGLPTSTTVSMVFGLLGAGVAAALFHIWGDAGASIADLSQYINTGKAMAIIAAILHSVSLIVFPEQNGVTTPYIAATILLLYAMMREDRARYAARSRSYKAVAQADRPVAVYSHYDEVDDACRAAKGPLFNKNDFLTELERPDTVDRFSMIYAPLALALSIILALVSSLGRGEPVRFFWAFSAVTAVAAPIGLLCAFGAGYKNIARRLLASGAAIAGARQANLLRGTEEVVLAENDLFPTGSIELESIKAVGQMSEERILSFATSLTTAAGLELGRTLDAAARQHAIVPLSAQDVRAVEGGLTGHVGSSYVVLGTGALMVNMGITIPAEGDATTMYLLADTQLVGIIALRYMPTKNTYKAMRLMRRMHMNAVIAACDFNVSPAMVEEEFDLRRGFADQPDPAGVRRLLDPSYAKGDAPAAILTREGAGPFMQVLRCADKLAGAVRSALTLSTFAGLFGILIVFYLVFQNQAAALPVQHLLLYLLIWYIPVFIINQQAR